MRTRQSQWQVLWLSQSQLTVALRVIDHQFGGSSDREERSSGLPSPESDISGELVEDRETFVWSMASVAGQSLLPERQPVVDHFCLN